MSEKKQIQNIFLLITIVPTIIFAVCLITVWMKVNVSGWLKIVQFYAIIFPILNLAVDVIYHFKYKFNENFIKFRLIKYTVLIILITFSLGIAMEISNIDKNVFYKVIFLLDVIVAVVYLICLVVCFAKALEIGFKEMVLIACYFINIWIYKCGYKSSHFINWCYNRFCIGL